MIHSAVLLAKVMNIAQGSVAPSVETSSCKQMVEPQSRNIPWLPLKMYETAFLNNSHNSVSYFYLPAIFINQEKLKWAKHGDGQNTDP